MSTTTQDLYRTSAPSSRVRGESRANSSASPAISLTRVSAALAVLRVIVGTVFLAHGAQKLFVFGFGGVIGAFEGMGVPLPGIAGPAVALAEFSGGLALIAGFLTRPAAVGLGVVMLGAITMVHLPAGFFLPNGAEFALTLLAATVALAITGPGVFSLDALLARRRSRDD